MPENTAVKSPECDGKGSPNLDTNSYGITRKGTELNETKITHTL